MKMHHLLTTLVAFLFAGSVFAAPEASVNRSVATKYASTTDDAGWIPSLGLSFGHLDQSGNSDVDGDAVTAQVVGTYYFDNTAWLADAGLGFQKHYFKEADAQPTTGIFSLSGRYSFPRRWSIGPAVDVLFGTNEDEFGTGNDYVTMAGLVGFKEIVFQNDQLSRVGLKWAQEVGQTGQTSNFIGLVGQWGIGSQNSVVRATTASR